MNKINGYTEEEAKSLVEYFGRQAGGKDADVSFRDIRSAARPSERERKELLLRAHEEPEEGRNGCKALGREAAFGGADP